MDKNNDVENRIGIEIDQLNPIEEKETLKEGVRRNPETMEDELLEDDNIPHISYGKIIIDKRFPPKNLLSGKKAVGD